MNGNISNVQVWGTELSSADALSIYNNGQPSTTAFGSPVSWWKLDNTTTGIQDSIGSNNGTNNGATEIQTNVWTPRLNADSDTLPSTALVSSDLQFNSAYSSFSLDFDGTNDYIDCGNLTFLNGISAFSTSAWFKSTSVGAGIILNGYQSMTEKFWVQLLNSTTIRYVSSFNNKDVTVSNIEDGSWHNIVTVHNGTSLDISLDGIKQNSSPLTVTAPTGNIGNNFLLGRLSYASANYFNGKLDEVSIFNKVLNQTNRMNNIIDDLLK